MTSSVQLVGMEVLTLTLNPTRHPAPKHLAQEILNPYPKANPYPKSLGQKVLGRSFWGRMLATTLQTYSQETSYSYTGLHKFPHIPGPVTEKQVTLSTEEQTEIIITGIYVMNIVYAELGCELVIQILVLISSCLAY